MLERLIEKEIYDHFDVHQNKVLIVTGARQVGKSYIIRHVCKKRFKNYIEIDLHEDKLGNKLFENVTTINDFYLAISSGFGHKLGDSDDTLVFLDEIQEYPNLLSLFKFLKQDNKYQYVASGSLLGVTLSKTSQIPIGSIKIMKMEQLNFIEFLLANGFNHDAINQIRDSFLQEKSLNEGIHNRMLNLFKDYLIIGGMPDAVKTYLETKNLYAVREIHQDIFDLYMMDASKYDLENKLKIERIYKMIPSIMGNIKKRIVVKNIEDKKGARYNHYVDEFDYLINSGIATEVKAISNPTFPLLQSTSKNLLKLYLNDVGLLSSILFRNNIKAIKDDNKSINLGALYETMVANELKSKGYSLYYYDNKKRGEVDFLIDNFDNLTIVPIEIKSGKDYQIHSALNNMIKSNEISTKKAYVFSNNREVNIKNNIVYMPIYYISFL